MVTNFFSDPLNLCVYLCVISGIQISVQGFTLMPQVMSGFYRPLLQPLQVQAVHAQPGGFSGDAIFQEPLVQNCVVDVQVNCVPGRVAYCFIASYHKKSL